MTQNSLNCWEERFIAYLSLHINTGDAAHDTGHFRRVWRCAQHINNAEGNPANELALLTAAYFHDLVSLPKNHPQKNRSSLLSAEKTGRLLQTEWPDFPQALIPSVTHAIHAHSFSAGIQPETWEARILQDADRLEALGAIGLARLFYVAGQLQTYLFHPDDPLAQNRIPDDKQYALDHFEIKLFRLPALMNTETARKIANEKVSYMHNFLDKINTEIAG